MTVSATSGCSNRTKPQTGWLINNRNLFLQFWSWEGQDHGWKARMTRIWEGCSHLCVLTWWKETAWSLLQGMKPIHEDPSRTASSPPKDPCPWTITLGARISAHEVGGDTNVQSIQWLCFCLCLDKIINSFVLSHFPIASESTSFIWDCLCTILYNRRITWPRCEHLVSSLSLSSLLSSNVICKTFC